MNINTRRKKITLIFDINFTPEGQYFDDWYYLGFIVRAEINLPISYNRYVRNVWPKKLFTTKSQIADQRNTKMCKH